MKAFKSPVCGSAAAATIAAFRICLASAFDCWLCWPSGKRSGNKIFDGGGFWDQEEIIVYSRNIGEIV